MISARYRLFGAVVLMSLTLSFSGEVLAKKHATETTSITSPLKQTHSPLLTSSKKEYSRNSVSRSLPDLRQYPSGPKRKQAFLRTLMPSVSQRNAAITAERNWLIAKQYDARWAPSERTRLQALAARYKVSWNGNTRQIPWTALLERVDIIPGSMVATMAAAESGWGTSKLARANTNLFGMKCAKRSCNSEPGRVKGYLHFTSVNESVDAYVNNLNTHPAYQSFRASRAKLRKADTELTAGNMIHKLEGYSTKGKSYNNFLLSMYQSNQRLMTAAN